VMIGALVGGPIKAKRPTSNPKNPPAVQGQIALDRRSFSDAQLAKRYEVSEPR
jgi:hypothetical protein